MAMQCGSPGRLSLRPGGISRGRSLPLDTALCHNTRTVPSSLWPPWRHFTGRGQKKPSCPDS